MRYLTLMAGLLLTACNLQAVPPTPTSLPDIASPAPLVTATELPTRTPAINTGPTTTLQPTPTQQLFTTATLAGPPTVINAGTPAGGPTLDPSQADGVTDVTITGSVDLVYTVEVTRGTLTFTVQGAPGIIWQQVFTTSEASRATITAPQDGAYQLVINTANFDGSYNFRWE